MRLTPNARATSDGVICLTHGKEISPPTIKMLIPLPLQLDVPTFEVMVLFRAYAGVLRVAHNLDIRRIVVQLVRVSMVRILIGLELPSEFGGGNLAMKSLATLRASGDADIPTIILVAAFVHLGPTRFLVTLGRQRKPPVLPAR